MAFLVAGLWRPLDGRPVGAASTGGATPRGGDNPTNFDQAEVAVSSSVGDLSAEVDGVAAVDGGDNPTNLDHEEVAAGRSTEAPSHRVEGDASAHGDSRPTNASKKAQAAFDWAAYRAVWRDVPIDEAITAMFAEFALLHAELVGSVRSTAAPTMTLNVGKGIADRAERFVIKYVTPILGQQQSIKVHKLMCHVLDAIRMHGNIENGNAAVNESLHKDDKPYYGRTSRDLDNFTAQLVVQAQGSRGLLERIAEEEDGAAASSHAESVDGEVAEADFTDDDDRASGLGGTCPKSQEESQDEEQDPLSAGGSPGQPSGRTRAYHLPLVRLSRLALVPGLAGVEAALGMDSDAQVRVASRVPLIARFDDGTEARQLLYASQSFRGSPWYDAVMYSPTGDGTAVSVGEVRAIVRKPEGDIAVLADMRVVSPAPRCPLVARGCTRLAWLVPEGQGDVCLRAVPLSSIRRVLHVVPDFQDLVSRRGLEALPAAMTAPPEERLAMRYFLNDFYVWG